MEERVIDCNQPTEKPQPKLKYEPARIITYTSEQILEEIGPAQTCSPDPCPVDP
ncbi:MAG: hypothetical protein JXQ27_14395 [Acidobacteria bacterium]|nr:hypothetical protein [Acidobacteriota bacterium]